MTAASYWSLLAPAIELAEISGLYGSKGEWAFIPVSIGFVLGAVFVYGADILMPYIVSTHTVLDLARIFGLEVIKECIQMFVDLSSFIVIHV